MTKKKWKREDITPEVLRELLHLDEETGKLYWKERDEKWFSDGKNRHGGVMPAKSYAKTWNAKYAGKEAFCRNPKGRYSSTVGTIFNITLTKNYVEYAIINGSFPEHCAFRKCDGTLIDIPQWYAALVHSGTVKDDTYRGVGVVSDLMNSNGTYNDRFFVAWFGRSCLGYFKTPIEAARAYDAAAFEKYGQHARLNFPEEYGLEVEFEEAPEGYDPTIISA